MGAFGHESLTQGLSRGGPFSLPLGKLRGHPLPPYPMSSSLLSSGFSPFLLFPGKVCFKPSQSSSMPGFPQPFKDVKITQCLSCLLFLLRGLVMCLVPPFCQATRWAAHPPLLPIHVRSLQCQKDTSGRSTVCSSTLANQSVVFQVNSPSNTTGAT